MNERCLTADEVAAALAAGPDHPARRHLDGCPWCQALAASHDLFHDTDTPAPEADAAAAADRLAAFLDGEIVGHGRGSPASAGRMNRSRWRRRLVPISLATAAVLLAMVGLELGREPADQAPRGVNLRSAPGDEARLLLETPRRDEHGVIRLSWSAYRPGVTYAVELVDGRQAVVERLEVGERTSLHLPEAALSRLQAAPAPHFAVVVARADGDEIARSRPRFLPADAR